MNLNWLSDNIIFLTLGGSQSYGLSDSASDVDVKGLCVPPRKIEDDLFLNFEQAENHPHVEEKLGFLKNPQNPKFESTIYSLKKFFILASNVNPNIIEMLWTDMKDHYLVHPIMQRILDNKSIFLSSKAKFTFSGYAHSQLAKIERHRKWIILGDVIKPTRSEFELPDEKYKGMDEVFSYVKSKVEEWNFNQFALDEQHRSDLKESIWELVGALVQKRIGWDNWPEVYADGVIKKMSTDLSLRDDVINLIRTERKYSKALDNYNSWMKWKSERNPARRELELKSGYDTKHASHLIRLLRMGHEIISQGTVIVKRPDREELLAIKNGKWSYDTILEYSKNLQSQLDIDYKTTQLPKSVDFTRLNDFYHELIAEYHNEK